MQWYVTTSGKTSEPSDERAIVEAIRGGLDPSALICEVGAKEWRALASHPAFGAALAQRLPPPPPPTAATQQPRSPDEALGIISLIAAFAATLAVWLWVGQMHRFEDPSGKLNLLTFGMVAMTSLLSAIEAGQLGFGSPRDLDAKGRRRSGPVAWFFFMVLMWIVAFPAYMWRRSTYGAKNMAVGGIVVAFAYTASALLMAAVIAR